MQPEPRWTTQDLDGTARAIDAWWELAVAGIDPLPAELVAIRSTVDGPGGLRDRVVRDTGADGDHDTDDRAGAGTALVRALSDAGRAAHRAGAGPTPHTGRVAAIHVSSGGVPKTPVERADIGWRGLTGDRQRTRRHHGRIWQAVCLWSAEVVERLAAEGHPIHHGAAGENLTLSGVEWAAMRPGTRVGVGTALLEITVPALPCSQNARWFLGGDFGRMHHVSHPGDSRLYAMVIETGEVARGDPAVVEP